MTKIILTAALLSIGVTALAQQPADFAASIKSQYKQNQGYILASAAQWPEDAYGWKPAGLDAELRTFGQLLVHIANENNQQCSRVLGKPNPIAADDSKAAYTKAQATRILKDSFAFCDPVFESLTNSNMADMVTMPGRGAATMQRGRRRIR